MSRFAPLLSVTLLSSVLGCSSSEYQPRVRPESDALASRIHAVEVYLVESCEGLERSTAPPMSFEGRVVARDGEPSPALGHVEAGPAAFFALARNERCEVVGAGCAEVEISDGGGGEIIIPVSERAGAGCRSTEGCMEGLCVDTGTCDVPSVEDFCTEIPGLALAPTIDAELECGLVLQPMPIVGYVGEDGQPEPTDVTSVSYAVAHRPDGLYFYLDVETVRLEDTPQIAEPYCGPSVELHVDADAVFEMLGMHDLPGTRQLVISAPPDSRSRAYWEDPFDETQYALFSAFATRLTETGYVVEALVGPEDLGLPSGTPMGPDQVGFALSLNVSVLAGEPVWLSGCQLGGRPLGVRYGQYVMVSTPPTARCPMGWPHCDTEAYCTPLVVR